MRTSRAVVYEELKDLQAVSNGTVKHCLALLAVDRMQTQVMPDSLYRQIAKLLAEADEPTLQVILEMADAVQDLEHHFKTPSCVRPSGRTVLHLRRRGMNRFSSIRRSIPVAPLRQVVSKAQHRQAAAIEATPRPSTVTSPGTTRRTTVTACARTRCDKVRASWRRGRRARRARSRAPSRARAASWPSGPGTRRPPSPGSR